VSHLTDFQTFLLLSILKIVVVLVITLTAVAYTVLLERKVLGRMQNRWGPSRVGPFGLLQPLADGIKLFLKEDLMPMASDKPLFIIAPIIALTCALISIAVVPFGAVTHIAGVDMFAIADINIGLLVILGITSIGVYGIALSGWSSNNKFALLGSLRATSQVISYELALGLSLVGVVLRAGSLRLRDIVASQSAHGALSWNVFGGFQIVAFFIYLMAAYAETNRAPFDLPEAESELVAGFAVEYSSTPYLLFMLGEYVAITTMCALTTIMFLGGWLPPADVWPLNLVSGFVWFMLKVVFVFFMFAMVKAFVPRYRYDQLMRLGWKVFLPLSLFMVVAVAAVLHVFELAP